jgi:hypothetical protein
MALRAAFRVSNGCTSGYLRKNLALTPIRGRASERPRYDFRAMDTELKQLLEEMRQENAAAHAETRQHLREIGGGPA